MSASRITLGVFWLFAGTMHFLKPKPYDRTIPPPLDRYAREITYASGVAELAGGVLALSGPRRLTRWYILLLLAAVYPANVYMAIEHERFRAVPRWALIARLPVQFVFAWHAIAGTRA
jgi:uncharacterized membrane protein